MTKLFNPITLEWTNKLWEPYRTEIVKVASHANKLHWWHAIEIAAATVDTLYRFNGLKIVTCTCNSKQPGLALNFSQDLSNHIQFHHVHHHKHNLSIIRFIGWLHYICQIWFECTCSCFILCGIVFNPWNSNKIAIDEIINYRVARFSLSQSLYNTNGCEPITRYDAIQIIC